MFIGQGMKALDFLPNRSDLDETEYWVLIFLPLRSDEGLMGGWMMDVMCRLDR